MENWQFLKIWNKKFLHNPAIPTHISKRTANICPHNNLYMNVHSSINSQKVETNVRRLIINNIWYIHTVEYYSATKRYEDQYRLQYGWPLETYTKWRRLVHLTGYLYNVFPLTISLLCFTLYHPNTVSSIILPSDQK